MNYKEMLDTFKDLERRLKVAENTVRALEHRVVALERPGFQPSWPTPVNPPQQPMWPQEFWPTVYPNIVVTTKDTTK